MLLEDNQFIFLSKDSAEITGNLTSTCNAECECQEEYYVPVCGADDVTYFTACHAGCSSSMDHNGTKVSFYLIR